MNEYDWLTCEDAGALLRYLYENQTQLYSICRPLLPDIKGDRFNVLPSNFIREVVGNPFRPVASYHCQWCETELKQPISDHCPECNTYDGEHGFWYSVTPPEFSWLTDSVRAFAQNITNSGDYNSVDVLADMLEEAGCDNEEILRHLRGEVRCAECGGDEIAIRDGPIFCTVCCNSCWLPKPVPCQPGCWVLRLLTEEK